VSEDPKGGLPQSEANSSYKRAIFIKAKDLLPERGCTLTRGKRQANGELAQDGSSSCRVGGSLPRVDAGADSGSPPEDNVVEHGGFSESG